MSEKNVLVILGSPHENFKSADMKLVGKVVCAKAKNMKELTKRSMKKIERCLK